MSQLAFLVAIIFGAISVYACEFGTNSPADFVTLPSVVIAVVAAGVGVWFRRLGL